MNRFGEFNLLALVAVGLLLASCASVDQGLVRSEIGGAESALRQARAGNANEHAPLELKLAEEKLSKANAAFEDDDYREAKYLAEEALADARLAQAKSQNAKTELMVQSLKDTIGDLRQEIEQTDQAQ